MIDEDGLNPIMSFSLDDNNNLMHQLENHENPERVGELLASVLSEENIVSVITEISKSYNELGIEGATILMSTGYDKIYKEGVDFLRPSEMNFGEVES